MDDDAEKRARELLSDLDAGVIEGLFPRIAEALRKAERDAIARYTRPGVAVAGEYVSDTIRALAHRCEVHIAEQQEKPLPDNALIGTLCDAIRMTREMVRFPPISPPAKEPDPDVSR